jgi:hypothetical protein
MLEPMRAYGIPVVHSSPATTTPAQTAQRPTPAKASACYVGPQRASFQPAGQPVVARPSPVQMAFVIPPPKLQAPSLSEERFPHGLGSPDGRRILDEHTRALAEFVEGGALTMASTSYSSALWEKGYNDYAGAIDALQHNRNALAQVRAQATTDSKNPNLRQAATERLHWTQERIADIDQVLARPVPCGSRDPDLIHIGETIPISFQPTEPHIVTPTEAKLDLLVAAKQRAPSVAHDNRYINDPMRVLAQKDAMGYAKEWLIKKHPGDAAWAAAITLAAPQARCEYSQERVRQEMGKKPPNVRDALEVLRVNMDGMPGQAGRDQLFACAGKSYFSSENIRTQLDGAMKQQFDKRGPSIAKWLSDYGTYAPPEVAQLAVDVIKADLNAPPMALTSLSDTFHNELHHDITRGHGEIYAGLSRLTQRADEHGDTTCKEMAHIIIDKVITEEIAVVKPGGMTGLQEGITKSAASADLSLSIAITTQVAAPIITNPLNPKNDYLKYFQESSQRAMVKGISQFCKQTDADGKAYSASNANALHLLAVAPLGGYQRTLQRGIGQDRLEHPEDANKVDALYDQVRDNGLKAGRMYLTIDSLPDNDGVKNNLFDALEPPDQKNSAVLAAMEVAAGKNVASNPADAYVSPLKDYLLQKIAFGPSADINALGASNQIRTPLQAAGNQTSVARHVFGGISIIGETLVASVLIKHLVIHAIWLKLTSVDDRFAKINANRKTWDRVATFAQADPGAFIALMGALQKHLPEITNAYRYGDYAARRQAFGNFGRDYTVGSTMQNLDPSVGRRAAFFKGVRALMAFTSAANNGTNAYQSYEAAPYIRDPQERAKANADFASGLAFAGMLGLFATDASAKAVRQALNRGTEGIVQSFISWATSKSPILKRADYQKISKFQLLAANLSKVPVGRRIGGKAVDVLIASGALSEQEISALRKNPVMPKEVRRKINAAAALTPNTMKVGQRIEPSQVKKLMQSGISLGYKNRGWTGLSTRGPELKALADISPGYTFLVSADTFWLATEVYKQLQTDPAQRDWVPTEIIGTINASNTVAAFLGYQSELWARRNVIANANAAELLQQGLTSNGKRTAYEIALKEATAIGGRAAFWEILAAGFGPIDATVQMGLGAAYFIYGYQKSKTTFEPRNNKRYAEMVKRVLQFTPEPYTAVSKTVEVRGGKRVKTPAEINAEIKADMDARVTAFMNQSGGSFTGPNPLPLWTQIGMTAIGGGPGVSVTSKIVGGGVQPGMLLTHYAVHKGLAGECQDFLRTATEPQLNALAHITADIGDHSDKYMVHDSDQLNSEGLTEFEARLRHSDVAFPKNLYEKPLQPNPVDDIPAQRNNTPMHKPEQPRQRTYTFKEGDTLWGTYGGGKGLDTAYGEGLLSAFDRHRQDGKF